MISRRRFIAAILGLSLTSLVRARQSIPHPWSKPSAAGTSEEALIQFVKIAIGTGGHGHTYPGATVPFGAVQLSPDTYNYGWDWSSGYHYSDTSIMGFSHTHLSGTGAGELLDFLVMPGNGPAKIVPGPRENPEAGYRSRFDHRDEIAEPGYYSVVLKDCQIRAELTATERAGFHKYTFPESLTSHFIIDLAHVFENKPILWSEIKIIGSDTIVGGRSTNGWAKGRHIYFAMQFSKPFAAFEIFSGDQKLDAGTREAKAKSLKCLVHYQTLRDEVVFVKTGISSVSSEGARKNLQAEIPHWNFGRVRAAAQRVWQRELSRIRIQTSDRKQKEIFYTSLYHTMLAPTLFDDVDGQYRGLDGQINTLHSGFHNYSSYSLWDTYRAVHPLYTLFQQERVPDLVNCLIRMAQESPMGMPVWPLQGIETSSMTGYHSAAVIAEALVKGFKQIDFASAYSAMKKRAMIDDYRGLGLYRKHGYIPADKERESVSKTLEYVYDDWAVAQVARFLGATDDAKLLMERSQNYINVFDQKLKFTRPRLENGEWAEPFDPKGVGHSKKWRDFTECNAWQSTFAIQHDLQRYIEMFGGREAFVEKLDVLFNQSSELPSDAPPDIAGLVGQYAHGNEPCHHIAYLYAYAGAPWKTQKRVRQLLDTMYKNDPDGLAGNEDCGQMSAWYVMSALGLYAVDPVSGNYVFGTPLFDRAVVELGHSKLIIEAQRQSPEDMYIQSVTLNGKPYKKAWVTHSDIAAGGKLVFILGPMPNKKWGGAPEAAPPSMSA